MGKIAICQNHSVKFSKSSEFVQLSVLEWSINSRTIKCGNFEWTRIEFIISYTKVWVCFFRRALQRPILEFPWSFLSDSLFFWRNLDFKKRFKNPEISRHSNETILQDILVSSCLIIIADDQSLTTMYCKQLSKCSCTYKQIFFHCKQQVAAWIIIYL